MEKEKNWWKRFSAFQIVAFVLTVLFVIGTIATIAILVNLKRKTDAAKDKNKEIEKVLESPSSASAWQVQYEKQIANLI